MGSDSRGNDVPTGPNEASTAAQEVHVCGDGMLDSGEECDDGNKDDLDACPSTCTAATCGDGFVWKDVEECDDGNEDDGDACLAHCVAAICGDGHVWADVEECDDADQDETDDCSSLCRLASCGDGVVHVGVEDCDEAGESVTCDGDCTVVECGDGHPNMLAGEECDDGNDSSLDNCYPSCKAPSMIVFLSSELYTGDLGGISGADAKCQALADAAQVAGKFRAWLWTNAIDPEGTFYHSPGKYIRLDKVEVAKNFEQFAAGELLAPFNVTELKEVVTGDQPNPYSEHVPYSTTWTGSNPDYWDYLNMPGRTCGNWTSGEDDPPFLYYGSTSLAENTTLGFAQFDMGISLVTYGCGVHAHLLCVQQAWYEDPRPG